MAVEAMTVMAAAVVATVLARRRDVTINRHRHDRVIL